MEKKLISIVMPVYNAENYIEEAVNSIVNQDYKEWELVIVDDFSVDNSRLIIERLAKKESRIKVVFNDTNKGISTARNIGLEQCEGEYVTFCDDDDEMDYNSLIDNVKIIEKFDVDIVRWGFEARYIDLNGYQKGMRHFRCEKKYYTTKKEIFQDYYNHRTVIGSVWTGLYRKSIIDKYRIRFNTDFKYGCEDTEFNIKMLGKINSMYTNNNCYYIWKVRDSHSTSVKRNENYCRSLITTATEEYDLLRENSSNFAVIWEKYQKQYKDMILNYADNMKLKDKYKKILSEIICFYETV